MGRLRSGERSGTAPRTPASADAPRALRFDDGRMKNRSGVAAKDCAALPRMPGNERNPG
ncbi:hypothetical protein LC55x_4509 [Lysobacter capsici]|nr:hypothetical protein LC55x_4509 [Lysobacter capsici]